jgi:peptide/nickel transport system substrate-binding protein
MTEPTRRRSLVPLERKLTRRRVLAGSAAAVGALAVADRSSAAGRRLLAHVQDAEPQQGGTLRLAIIGEPPVLADAMFTTATVTSNLAQQMFEGLFARDSTYAPRPMLAESHTVSPDGLTYEFKLRQGVTFHNGKPMTATDVVASLKRWGTLTGRGRLVSGRLASIEERDPSTVVMTFNQPTGVLLDFLALIEAFVLPAEIADAAGTEALTEEQLIGTGPFRFQERQVDQYIRLVRYDGYAAREDPADGAAGRKVAYLDQLEVIPVPDASVRADGLITGEYHFSEQVEPDQYDTIASDPGIQPLIVKPYYWCSPHFNKRQGLFTDVRLRRAVALAFSAEEAMISGFGREDFFGIQPSVAAPETTWHTEAGNDVYLQDDVEQARALLAEAGYAGQPVRWLTTREYPYNYNIAALVAQRLEAIGMPVELVVSDWATLVENRSKPEVYEIFLTGHSSYSHPATQPFNDKEWPGFWDNAEKDRILSDMLAATDPEQQQGFIDEYQNLIYAEMPFVKCGDYYFLRAARAEVQGYSNFPDWFFWNVGLSS